MKISYVEDAVIIFLLDVAEQSRLARPVGSCEGDMFTCSYKKSCALYKCRSPDGYILIFEFDDGTAAQIFDMLCMETDGFFFIRLLFDSKTVDPCLNTRSDLFHLLLFLVEVWFCSALSEIRIMLTFRFVYVPGPACFLNSCIFQVFLLCGILFILITLPFQSVVPDFTVLIIVSPIYLHRMVFDGPHFTRHPVYKTPVVGGDDFDARPSLEFSNEPADIPLIQVGGGFIKQHDAGIHFHRFLQI